MNKVILIGRLTKDPEVRYTSEPTQTAVAKFTIAVDRIGRDQGADFIPCVSFGKTAEFAEKYLKKGSKIALCGHIQTGSYTNKDGQKVYTTDVIVENAEFAEAKQENTAPHTSAKNTDLGDFMDLPDDLSDDGLPFN